MSGCFNNSQEDSFHEREVDEHTDGKEGNELKPIIDNILAGFCNAQKNIQKAREEE
jgi:hypothetical protein